LISIEEQWSKVLGTNGWDQGYSVKQTSDGGYILTGFSSNSQQNVYLIKLDNNGEVVWEKFFEDTLQGIGYSANEIPGEGYIVMGLGTATISDEKTLFLFKTDLNGEKQSLRFFDPPTSIAFRTALGQMPPYFFSLSETEDKGYIISGRVTSPFEYNHYIPTNIWLLKVNSNLEEQWETILARESDYFPATVEETADGGYIITGMTDANYSYNPQNSYDAFLIKIDATGKELLDWEKTFNIGDMGWKNDYVAFGKETSDNGYLIAGFAEVSGGGFCDIFLLKTDSEGNEQWRKTFNYQAWDWGYAAIETKDQGYLIVGGTDSFNPILDDIYLIKTDSMGNLVWSKILGEDNKSEVGFSIEQTKDGGYIVIGSQGEDILLIKLGPEVPEEIK
jgi:hypothetical protein